jgi:subtilisin
MSSRDTLSYAAWAAAVLAASCKDVPSTGSLGEPSTSLTVGQLGLRDLPALQVDLPDTRAPWDTNDAALIAKVRDEDGIVAIGFKEPGAARTIETRVREALTAETFAAGLALVEAEGGELIYVRKHIGSVHARIAPEVAATLRHNSLVDYVEPRLWGLLAGTRANSLATLRAVQECTPSSSVECLGWGVSWINARDAHLQGSAGFGGRILIIDTGHDHGHEDLPLVWLSHCAGPYDGCTDYTQGAPASHGTHVTGLFVGRDNDKGIVGTAPLVTESQVHVYGACDEDGRCAFNNVADGLDAAIAWDVQVVNMSLTGTAEQAGFLDLSTAVSAAQNFDNGILLVAAAGNIEYDPIEETYTEPGVLYPAAFDGVIGVSGIRADSGFAAQETTHPICPGPLLEEEKSPGSNYGSHVDLTSAFYAWSAVSDHAYDVFCGTSMATPHVAGVATLIRAKYPDLCASQVRQILFATAVDLGPSGRDDHYGHGLPDAVAALAGADAATPCSEPPPAPEPLTVNINGPTTMQPNSQCFYSSTVSGGTTPYSYQWYQSSTPVGNESSVTVSSSGYVSSFRLSLFVTDDGGLNESDDITVQISDDAPICRS